MIFPEEPNWGKGTLSQIPITPTKAGDYRIWSTRICFTQTVEPWED